MNPRFEQQSSGSIPSINSTSEAVAPQAAPSKRRRRWPLVAGLSAAAIVASGSVAFAQAQKTVTLDIDGTSKTITTYSGSVAGMLESQDVRLGDRDLVAPGADAKLSDGDEIVVRYARQVTMTDGKGERDVWVTVTDASEALTTLAERGGDVALVASRSGDRASLPLRLNDDGPVAVVADGKTRVVEDHSASVDSVLGGLEVELDKDDLVSVAPVATLARDKAIDKKAARSADRAGADVAIQVQRVETKKITQRFDLDFDTKTVQDDDRYVDEGDLVRNEGRQGVRTRIVLHRLVDGEVVHRKELSEKVTKKPVDRVIVEGTKERPVEEPVVETSVETAPEPSAPVPAGSVKEIGQQMAAARGWTGEEWTCLELLWERESGWNYQAANPTSSAYGIPQALPGSKMSTAGSDWATNPATQIEWGLGYIADRYGTPCGAWGHSESVGWY
ncbi:ubiquitin-like domain-containing protein [Promicromonospora panici]|uniref:aggregation-promoting factor C-terminal-like domain-containing protein n=1 Tax=Promicromonospora panici TaxID=2219658 RepID=UPI00101B5E61|nr:ubiquitin-like domain-containing protein [Promicromonospora panici]